MQPEKKHDKHIIPHSIGILIFNPMFILALASLFIKMSASNSLHPQLTGPEMAYLNSRVAIRCFTPNFSPPVIYELLRDKTFLIGTHVDQEGGQAAVFSLKVTAASHGSYQCKVTSGRRSEVSNSITLNIVTPASNTRVTSDPFPPVAYEGSRIALSCEVDRGSHLSYTWFFNRKEVTSAVSDFHVYRNKLVIEKVTTEHGGSYYCIAWSRVQDIRRFSTSTEVQLKIKVYLSKPKIFFSIIKDGNRYHGNVTCSSSRGSPPVDFSLSIDDAEVESVIASESLTAWFQVAMVPGLDMGEARCRVKTEKQELLSEPMTLEVVPVGGGVKVEVEYLYTAEAKAAAARLSCQISRGTFPYISWIFNNSALSSGENLHSHFHSALPHFGLTNHRRTLILPKLGKADAGFYRCRARDSYDQTGPVVESADVLVQITELVVTPLEVIIIIFCFFLLLMLVVASACVVKMFKSHPNTPIDSPTLCLSESQSARMHDEASLADCAIQNPMADITA